MDAYSEERPWLVNNPRWQLFAYGNVGDLLPTGTINSPFYVVVLIGDDPSETDDNPLVDGGPPAQCRAAAARSRQQGHRRASRCAPRPSARAARTRSSR